jgi:hypothetical protein
MLALDSEKWGELDHAYGSASDIPALLKKLPEAPVREQYDAEPWFSLWSAICHQCDVYTASYAAMPYVISAAAERRPEDRAEYFLMAGTIESMRHRSVSPEIPVELNDAYEAAVAAAIPLVLESLVVEKDEGWFKAMLSALAAFRGFPELSAAVVDLEREAVCPKCNEEFVVKGFDWFDESLNAP